MKKLLAWVLCLVLLSGMAGCADETQAAPPLLEPVGVKASTVLVQRDTICDAQTFAGQIVPYVEELHFTADGKLGQILVRPGEWVEEGQVLAALDEEAIQAQIEKLDEQIYEISMLGTYSDRQTAADIGIAKVELEKLRAQNASEQACAEKELEIQKLELELKQAQELRDLELGNKYSAINTLRESLETTKLLAPFAGRIVYVKDIKEGASVQAFATVLCIADDTRLLLQTELKQESIFTGADRLYAQILDKTYDITYQPYDRDTYLSMTLSGQQMTARFTVEAKPGELESGQFAAVVALDNYKEDVLTVPVNALYRDGNGRYVYKLVDGRQERCYVTVGLITETKIEILEGLREGDVICVNN